jgi:hypothetical protein
VLLGGDNAPAQIAQSATYAGRRITVGNVYEYQPVQGRVRAETLLVRVINVQAEVVRVEFPDGEQIALLPEHLGDLRTLVDFLAEQEPARGTE